MMAGDWIKMRGALIRAPKLIRMTRELQGSEAFRDWLTPGGGGAINGQIVSDEALRCVTFALLGVTWSYAREHGKWRGDDLLLPYITLDDLDGIAGVDGFGDAMQCVNWAFEPEDETGVIFPNFREFNVPMTAAEKQRDYRKRKKDGNGKSNGGVTKASNAQASNVTTREEESREEHKSERAARESDEATEEEIPADLDTPDFRTAWRSWCDWYLTQTGRAPAKQQRYVWLQDLQGRGAEKAVRDINHSIGCSATMLYDSDRPRRNDKGGNQRPRKKLNL